TPERAILDSGRKTLNPDVHVPLVAGHDDAEVTRLSAEHCELKLGPKSQALKIGDKVELVVGYGDFTTVLHDEFFGFRNDRLEVIWPILGRGKLQGGGGGVEQAQASVGRRSQEIVLRFDSESPAPKAACADTPSCAS